MIFICGYCNVGSDKHPPRWFQTWEDLVDHLLNEHRWRFNSNNKLERR